MIRDLHYILTIPLPITSSYLHRYRLFQVVLVRGSPSSPPPQGGIMGLHRNATHWGSAWVVSATSGCTFLSLLPTAPCFESAKVLILSFSQTHLPVPTSPCLCLCPPSRPLNGPEASCITACLHKAWSRQPEQVSPPPTLPCAIRE